MKTVSLLVLALALGAANAAPPKSNTDRADANPDEGVLCERKREAGSNMVKRVCTTAAEREASKEAARNKLQRMGNCSGNETACVSE